jgi:hypothetical protein
VSSATSLGNQQHVVPANHRLPTLGNEGESQGLDLNSDFEDYPEVSNDRRPVSPGSTPNRFPAAMGHSAEDLRPLHQRDPSRAGLAQRLEDPSFLPLDIETVDRLQTLLGINNDNQRLVIDLCSVSQNIVSLPVWKKTEHIYVCLSGSSVPARDIARVHVCISAPDACVIARVIPHSPSCASGTRTSGPSLPLHHQGEYKEAHA